MLVTFRDTGVGRGCNPSYFNPVGTLSLSFIGVRQVEGSRILSNKPRLSELF